MSVIYTTPQPYGSSEGCDSSNSQVVIIEGGGDTTIRPLPPELKEFRRRQQEKEKELLRLAEEYKQELEKQKRKQEDADKNPEGDGQVGGD